MRRGVFEAGGYPVEFPVFSNGESNLRPTAMFTRNLASMIDEMLSGKKVDVNDTKTYNNGVKVVPSYLLKPVVVDKSNWEKVLIDGGYYKRSQFD